MGSEGNDAEAAAAAGAIDSDASVSWEEFFGTSTDLVPQLLGMFDELARRGNGQQQQQHCSYENDDHRVVTESEGSQSCNSDIPVSLQKRLSLVPPSHRRSIFGRLSASSEQTMLLLSRSPAEVETAIKSSSNEERSSIDMSTVAQTEAGTETIKEKSSIYRAGDSTTPLRRVSERCGDVTPTTGSCRPLSASSIASSTSSSGCSNQENPRTLNNPYLTSVESLADTCASSQGSGDSGVIALSDSNCRIRDIGIGSCTNGGGASNGEHIRIHQRPRHAHSQRNPVERVLMEIVDTEAIYVEHLRQVIQGYLIFWRDDPEGLVRQFQLNDLFSNIEDIFEFNREFLKELEACGLNPVTVADTFIKHNAGFKVYTEYCTNYPRTVFVLTELMGQEATANAFRERQSALNHALPLGSFLLKPVQRILKYHLLLENLSKEYGAGCEQNGNEAAIEGALEAMTGIAKHINAMKRRHEHAVRVQEIQSLLYGWSGPDLTTSGELVAEGRFRMRGAKAPRHAFLFERMLLLTKKKEDGLLVYKAHILCSNLMLIESIPGEPSTFHVIPFDNPRLQYTLQARNVEQKREWALQLKRVILENYNAVIPSHARQLVLQLGQSQQDEDSPVEKGSAKKQYSAPPEYLERRKQDKDRRRSESGLRQKLIKHPAKSSDISTTSSIENSPLSSCKNVSELSSLQRSRDRTFNRSLDARASKVKDRFTNWRRKSEPGFQSYVSLNESNAEESLNTSNAIDSIDLEQRESEESLPSQDSQSNLQETDAKYSNEQDQKSQKVQTQTVEQIVGHILMQNQEFQRLLEKQRNNSILNVRHQQRFNKHVSTEISDESDNEILYNNQNNNSNRQNNNNNNRMKDNRIIRSNNSEHRLVRTNNAWNALSSAQPRDVQPTLQLRYDNLRSDNEKSYLSNNRIIEKMRISRVEERRKMFETFKRQSITTDSKIIKTALRIRENVGNDEIANKTSQMREEFQVFSDDENYHSQDISNGEEKEEILCQESTQVIKKADSLPRSFQIASNTDVQIDKTRFFHRDCKTYDRRPMTIASDKPTDVNFDDIEKYVSTYEPEERIAKFPTSPSTSTFFLSLDDSQTGNVYPVNPLISTDIHPDHKIYRSNMSGSGIFKNVLSKAGDKFQVLRTAMSSETLESDGKLETRKSRNFGVKMKKKSKIRGSQDSSIDVDDYSVVGCTTTAQSVLNLKNPEAYYKQGSSGLGARIAQSDYADPSFLFNDYKRMELLSHTDGGNIETTTLPNAKPLQNIDRRDNQFETDSFYERSFESIENYVDHDGIAGEDAFRDSAIFSDADDVIPLRQNNDNDNNISLLPSGDKAKRKIVPPVPPKTRKITTIKTKPVIARKPKNLTLATNFTKPRIQLKPTLRSKESVTPKRLLINNDNDTREIENSDEKFPEENHDVSVGQSQAGWVRKMVVQLQAHSDTS